MHIIDSIIVSIYLVLCIFIGLYKSKSKSVRTLKEYTLGRGYFSNIVIITTLFTTHIGAVSVMGGIEEVYTLGMFFVVTRLLSPLFWLIMARIYGDNIDQFRNLMSLSDIMVLLYGKIGRWITNIFSMLLSIGVVAIQAKAMGYLVNYFFDINYSLTLRKIDKISSKVVEVGKNKHSSMSKKILDIYSDYLICQNKYATA
ncbi:MAG: hypothetical protein ACRY3E_05785, partial [Candidatus Lariskella arthropodorum]